MREFSKDSLTTEDAFWVMFYFLDGHYKLSKGQWDITDVLSMCQPFEFNEKGHFDGKVLGDRFVSPADSAMISNWNAAVKKYKEEGRPGTTALKK